MRSLPIFAAAGVATFLFGPAGASPVIAAGIPPLPNCEAFDDGSSNNAVGLQFGGGIVWMHRQGVTGQLTSLLGVQVAYGTIPGPTAPPAGTPVTIAVDDPNDDGNPDDLVLVRTVASSVQNGDTDTLNSTILDPVVTVSGMYFIGVALTHLPGTFPAALDISAGLSMGRAWLAANPNGPVDLTNLSGALLPPTDVDQLGLPGVWLLRASCFQPTGVGYCEGTVADCPCGNAGGVGRGCSNSAGASGGLLTALGVASIASDTVTLIAGGLPSTSPCLFAQGTATSSGVFGDGRQCLGGNVLRLRTRTAFNGIAQLGYPSAGDPLISVAGAVSAGTYHYQGMYRDAPSFCTAATFNATNGYTIVWN